MLRQSYLNRSAARTPMLSFLLLCLHSLTTLPRRELRGEGRWLGSSSGPRRETPCPAKVTCRCQVVVASAAAAGAREHISAPRSRTGRARTTSCVRASVKQNQQQQSPAQPVGPHVALCARALITLAYLMLGKGCPGAYANQRIRLSVAVFLTCSTAQVKPKS